MSIIQSQTNKPKSYWQGKRIVWFGTSIPAGVVDVGESGGNGSYPERIGQLLGATVYNESVGSSRVRAGNHIAATNMDPFGWSGMSVTGILLSLSLSSKEKLKFIDEWNEKWSSIVSDTKHIMDNLDEEKIQKYLDSSWDVKLTKYLSGGSCGPVDLYVFDMVLMNPLFLVCLMTC